MKFTLSFQRTADLHIQTVAFAMAPVHSNVMSSTSRPPVFTVASWIAPALCTALTFLAVNMAQSAGRARGRWLSGLTELIVGIFVVAFFAFACGLMALLRRERHRWLAVLPFAVGLGVFLYVGWQRLR